MYKNIDLNNQYLFSSNKLDIHCPYCNGKMLKIDDTLKCDKPCRFAIYYYNDTINIEFYIALFDGNKWADFNWPIGRVKNILTLNFEPDFSNLPELIKKYELLRFYE